MKKWLKRIRGALGMGLTWAVAWSPFGAILGLVLWVVIGGTPLLNTLVGFVAAAATLGFVGGAAFSVVLGIAEGRRRFDEMSLPRFAGWGALGGLLVTLVMALVLGDPVFGPAGVGIIVPAWPVLAAAAPHQARRGNAPSGKIAHHRQGSFGA